MYRTFSISTFLVTTFMLSALGLFAQKAVVEGTLKDGTTQNPLEGVIISIDNVSIPTNTTGYFRMSVEAGKKILVVNDEHFELYRKELDLKAGEKVSLGDITLGKRETSETNAIERIPTITLSDSDSKDGQQNQDVSGLLSASRDPFAQAAAALGGLRFRMRGYDSEYTEVFMNGVPINDLETGRTFWGAWGGLNDVMRNRENGLGLTPNDFTIGGIAGATDIDTRAGRQRKQIRVTYSNSNNDYANRLMGTYSTGQLDNGWAFSLSGSRRWSQEGYEPGTYFDGWSYFASIDKKLNTAHSLNLTVFGTPTKRGSNGASTKELYELTGSNYYNASWGYQNGEKRNARSNITHQPIAVLRHDWTMSDRASLTTAVNFQTGRNGRTGLTWFNAPDPRPDYYRNLPSYIENETLRAQVYNFFKNNPDELQLDWHEMYNINRNSDAEIVDASGNVLKQGKLARYFIEERRNDAQNINFNTAYQNILNDNMTLQGGLSYQMSNKHFFTSINDLLGAEFHWDIDKFAQRTYSNDPSKWQSNLNTPNQFLQEGDTYGYDYNMNINKGNAWLQGQFSYEKIDFFLGAGATYTQFWRTGNFKNGLYPDNSLGDSEKQNYFDYKAKGGLVYKINGRNYLYANGFYQTLAPFASTAYVAPTKRDQLISDLKSSNITSAELGYSLRSPYFKGRASIYYTTINNQVDNKTFFIEDLLVGDVFGNYIMKDIDQRHIGAEVALEAKLTSSLKMTGVASVGQYKYTNRPTATIYLDDSAAKVAEYTIYQKNFNIAGTPQTAFTAGLNYNSPKFWFVNLNFNYVMNNWVEFNPDRRNTRAITYPNGTFVDSSSPLWQDILYQEEIPNAFTIDLFGGKSWKIKQYYLYFNLGINNVLNNQDIITGGYESLRFDFAEKNVNKYPNRYFYATGLNYFASLSFRM